MSVAGKGSVRLVFDGTTFLVRDVYYVPVLRNNLLSMGQLQEKGLAIFIKKWATQYLSSIQGLNHAHKHECQLYVCPFQ